MGVQAAIAFLNGNDTDPIAPSPISKRPTTPKSTTSNWTPQRTTADKQKDNSLNSIKPNITTPSKTDAVSSSTSGRTQKSRTNIDLFIEELVLQYQEALDKNESSKEIIARLESDVELYACDSTKVRDYEIRVEYLAQKLEQVSEERDLLEQELSTYKDQHGTWHTPDVPGGKPTMTETALETTYQKNQLHNNNSDNNDAIERQHQQQQQQLEDIYFDEILDAYEERRSMDNDGMIQQHEHNEQMMTQMLAEYDQGMKMAMEVYVADLAKQRLENKTLQSMVKKQDELIKKLEIQCGDCNPSGDNQHLTNNSTKKNDSGLQQQRLPPSVRSSIDVLAEMARNDSAPESSLGPIHRRHHQQDTGRNTPPPFAPPKTPLPPLPAGDHSNTSINNDSLISCSRSSTSSTTWSSDDQHQQPQQHPLSATTTELLTKHNSTENHHHTNYIDLVRGDRAFDSGADSSAASGTFWSGLKKKF